ncbi:MAG TPA: hypothetical protein VN920_02945 [Pyrinomonadaceae bacterium]|nr:hypothetical protein [Pyrinomonadaceae bacterium]
MAAEDGTVSVNYGDVFKKGELKVEHYDLDTLAPLLTGYSPLNSDGCNAKTANYCATFAPRFCPEAQKKNPRISFVRSRTSGAEGQGVQIIFDYYPRVLDLNQTESESVFVAVNADGSAQAVRYGPYNPAIVAVYEGVLPETDVKRLIVQVQLAIPKASEINTPYVGSCDAESFQLSLKSKNGGGGQGLMPYPGCLPVMPKEIRDLVEEMRGVWKRLTESSLAEAYVRSFPFEQNSLRSAQSNSRRFVSIKKFPHDLQIMVHNASKLTPRYCPISRRQHNRLMALTADPSHFFVIDNDRAYSLTLLLSRKTLHSLPPRRVDSETSTYQPQKSP